LKKSGFFALAPLLRCLLLSALLTGLFSACSNDNKASDAVAIPTTISYNTHASSVSHILKGVQQGPVTIFTLPSQTGIKNLVNIASTVWFSESDTNKIGKIDAQGQFSEYSLPTADAQPSWGTAGAGGSYWFSEENVNRIAELSSQGSITEYPIPTPHAQPGQMLLWGNLIWFAETGAEKLARINQDNQMVEFTLNGAPDQIVSAGSEEKNGLLWFSEPTDHKIGRITFDGQISEFPLPSSVTKLGSIVGDGDGNLWFSTGQSSHDQLGYVTPEGHFSFFSTSRSNTVAQLLWDGSTITFVEQNGNTIWAIDKQGAIQPHLAAPDHLTLPTPLILDPNNGNYWYAKTNGQQSQLWNLTISPYGP